MKVLALDVGSKRIGIAKGYQENEMIFPVETLSRKSVRKGPFFMNGSLNLKKGVGGIGWVGPSVSY